MKHLRNLLILGIFVIAWLNDTQAAQSTSTLVPITSSGLITKVTLPETISYTFGFERDSNCFIGDHRFIVGKTKQWVVLVNFHGDMELNITNVFDPSKRTLSWAIPYPMALLAIQKIDHINEVLALLKAWNKGDARKRVSFILVPPDSILTFKIGFAKPQTHLKQRESRFGGGIQMRLQSLPRGSVILTTYLLSGPRKKSSKIAGVDIYDRDFSIEKIFEQEIQRAQDDGFIPASICTDIRTDAEKSTWTCSKTKYRPYLEHILEIQEFKLIHAPDMIIKRSLPDNPYHSYDLDVVNAGTFAATEPPIVSPSDLLWQPSNSSSVVLPQHVRPSAGG